MSEPVLSPAEIARHAKPSGLLYDRLRAVVVAHRIPLDDVDPLVRDLVLEIAAHKVGDAA